MSSRTSRQITFRRLGFALVVGAVCLTQAGCVVSRVQTRGNLPDPAKVAELKPGATSKDDILDLLGSPSSINTFGKETWYYISEKTETVAFFKPEVLERKVLIVEFDKNHQMSQIVSLGLDAGREVAHVERVTPTFGQELTVLDQILGNFRRFTGNKTISN